MITFNWLDLDLKPIYAKYKYFAINYHGEGHVFLDMPYLKGSFYTHDSYTNMSIYVGEFSNVNWQHSLQRRK